MLIRANGGSVGRRLLVDRRVSIRNLPNSGWRLGDDVYIGVGTILDVGREASISLGSGVKIMHYVVIGASLHVHIGENSQVAEFSSVRDSDHVIDTDLTMIQSGLISTPVHVGDNCWIGRSSAILRGTHLGNGCVVAANSVVKATFADDSVLAGAPAVLKRLRNARLGK